MPEHGRHLRCKCLSGNFPAIPFHNRKYDLVSVKELMADLISFPVSLVKDRISIFAVPQKRMAHRRQMRSDLMGFPGDQMNLKKRKLFSPRQREILGLDPDPAAAADGYRVIRLILLKESMKTLRFGDPSLHRAQILLLKRPILKKLPHSL